MGRDKAGKRFEGKFRVSLSHVPGRSRRIEDGGREGRERQWADFELLADDGKVFFFECKATREKSFPFANIKDHQLAALKAHSDQHPNFISIIAINFYGENIRQKNDCYLVDIDSFIEYMISTNRKSIHESEVARIGEHMPMTKGNIWALDPWAVVK